MYVFLKTTEYAVGTHVYGRLEFMVNGDWASISLSYTLTESEARKLSEPTFSYKEGDTSERFPSKDRLIEAAIESVPEGATALFDGYGMPAYLLWHEDPKLIHAANNIADRYYGGATSRNEMENMLEEWIGILGIKSKSLFYHFS